MQQEPIQDCKRLPHHKVGRQKGLHLALAAVGLPDGEGHVEAVVLMPGQQRAPF